MNTAIQLDSEFEELERNDTRNYNFRRLLGATTNEFQSHGGQTSATLMLSILKELGKKRMKEYKYFMDVGAGCGQPSFLVDRLKSRGMMGKETRVIAIEKDEERYRFLLDRATDSGVRDRIEIKHMNVQLLAFEELMDSLNSGMGLVYWNNWNWGSDTVAAVENTLVEKLHDGSCVISTKQLFLGKRNSNYEQPITENAISFEIANNELSWYGSTKDVDIYYYFLLDR